MNWRTKFYKNQRKYFSLQKTFFFQMNSLIFQNPHEFFNFCSQYFEKWTKRYESLTFPYQNLNQFPKFLGWLTSSFTVTALNFFPKTIFSKVQENSRTIQIYSDKLTNSFKTKMKYFVCLYGTIFFKILIIFWHYFYANLIFLASFIQLIFSRIFNSSVGIHNSHFWLGVYV